MKKERYYKYIYAASLALVFVFIIMVAIDYVAYNPIGTSAPFYVNIIIRAIEFLIPSLIVFIIGFIFRRKYKK